MRILAWSVAAAAVLGAAVGGGVFAQQADADMARCEALIERLERALEGEIPDLNKRSVAADELDEALEAREDGDADDCLDALEEAFEALNLPFDAPDADAVRAAVRAMGLDSLATVKAPTPPNLSEFVRPGREEIAIRLGKALFWDMQVGSDGQACGTCHFHAGADNRLKHQLNPGTRGGDKRFGATLTAEGTAAGAPADAFKPNGIMHAGHFPFRLLKDSEEPNYAKRVLLRDSNDVMSSQGVRRQIFAGLSGGPNDLGRPEPDDTFAAKGLNLRRVEPRNTPTVVNSVFNVDNFWDGRARSDFNGVTPFGRLDQGARILVAEGGALVERAVAIPNSSLASQAVGPPTNEDEMSFAGRNFVHIGRKLLNVRPLALQEVHPQDSVLGPLSRAREGLPGLSVATYAEWVREAFDPRYWSAADQVVIEGPNGRTIRPAAGAGPEAFTQIEANFALFFGLSIQLYEATLISDRTPFDRFMQGEDAALTADQIAGLMTFINRGTDAQKQNPLFAGMRRGNCVACHGGPELTNAGVTVAASGRVAVQPTAAMQDGRLVPNAQTAFIDLGFANIGVRPTAEDLGRGGIEAGQPLSLVRQALARLSFAPPLARCGGTGEPACPAGSPGAPRMGVEGAFKIPGLRNVELTGPYFHNGGQLSLKQTIEFYDRFADFADVNISDLDGEMALVDLEEDDEPLVTAFLLALTDERVRLEAAPFDHPQIFVPSGHPGDEDGPNCALATLACDDRFESPAVGTGGRAAKGLPPLAAFLGGGLEEEEDDDDDEDEEEEEEEEERK